MIKPFYKSLMHLSLLLALFGSVLTAHADFMYRYTDDNGVMVIEYTVPPEAVHNGYEILRSDGSIYQVVPRALSQEERRDSQNAEVRRQLELKEQEELRKWDQSLLLRYSTISDIEASRERNLSELKIRISILHSNIRSLKQQVESNQSRAADIERGGGEVPVATIATIDGLKAEIVEAEKAVSDRKLEIEKVTQSFAKDIERFKHLLDMVELRKQSFKLPD
jgi:hypothetical protein